MITAERIRKLVDEKVGSGPLFLVEIKVSPGNKIAVFIDGDQGVSVSDCKELHRFIESAFDRDAEDFELMVSTSGADQPLKMPRQYQKNVGREVTVNLRDGKEVKGMLIASGEDSFALKTKDREKIEGRKSKQWVERELTIPYNEIIQTKIAISFK